MSFATTVAAAVAAASPSGAVDMHTHSREVGACLADKRPDVALTAISVSRGGPDERRLHELIATDEGVAQCFGRDRAAVDLTTLRGAAAESLYRLDFPSSEDGAKFPAEALPLTAQDTETKLRYWFAQCIVRSSSTAVDKLVRSQPGSPEERAAVTELTPALPGCLPRNMTAKFSRRELRAYASEALYRAATTARQFKICKAVTFEAAVRQELTCPPIPIGKGMMLRIDDYPSASFRAEEQGKVAIQYVVRSNGSVEPGSCVIVTSSGHDRLDQGTCELAEKRFQFRPSLLRGKPVPQTNSYTVLWTLPR